MLYFFRREHMGRRYGRAGHGWPGRKRWPVPPGRGPCRPPAVPGGEGQCAGARQESRQAAILFSQNPFCRWHTISRARFRLNRTFQHRRIRNLKFIWIFCILIWYIWRKKCLNLTQIRWRLFEVNGCKHFSFENLTKLLTLMAVNIFFWKSCQIIDVNGCNIFFWKSYQIIDVNGCKHFLLKILPN
jgi:hypothetical protein